MASKLGKLLVLSMLFALASSCSDETVSKDGYPPVPVLTTQDSELHFEFSSLGESSTKETTLSNDGDDPLVVTDVTIDGPSPSPFTVQLMSGVDYQGEDFTVEPHESLELHVAFTALEPTGVSAVLEIHSNDSDHERFPIRLTAWEAGWSPPTEAAP